MNKVLLMATILTAASVNAYATNTPENQRPKHDQKQSQQQNQKQGQAQGQTQEQVAKSASRSTASAVSRSTQETAASATGGSGGNSSNDGNAQSMSYSYSNNEALQRNNTPDMGSVLVYPTANCRVAYGGGVVGPGFGIQIGSSEPSEVCELIEISKQLKYLGLNDPSIQIMCQEPRAARAMGKICPVQTSANVSQEIVKP